MNTVLAPSATMLTTSNNGEENFPFDEVVSRIAAGKLKAAGFTRERVNLNPEKLVKSVIAEYRNSFAAIYPDKNRLPSAVVEKIQDAVGRWITGKLSSLIHKGNSIGATRGFIYRKPKLGEDTESPMWIEQVTQRGENRVSLEEQLFACHLEIGRIEKRLKDLAAKPTPDHELEKKYNERLNRQSREEIYLKAEIARQKGLQTT